MRNSFRYLYDTCYAKLNELGLVWGTFPFRPHNDFYRSHSTFIGFLSFSILCFSHNHTHPFITRSTPITPLTHSITHTHSMGCIPAKTERSPQTRFWTGANRSIDSRSSSSRSFSTHTHYLNLSFYHSLSHSFLSLIPFSSSPKRWLANATPPPLILSIPCCVREYTRFSTTLHSSIPTHSLYPPFHSIYGMGVGYEMIWWWNERKVWGWRNRFWDHCDLQGFLYLLVYISLCLISRIHNPYGMY